MQVYCLSAVANLMVVEPKLSRTETRLRGAVEIFFVQMHQEASWQQVSSKSEEMSEIRLPEYGNADILT